MDYKLKYKIRTIDFYVIIVLLLCTISSSFIASKIIYLPFTHIPLISASFIYVIKLPLTDLVRAYSTKRNAFKFIIIETIFEFLLYVIFYTAISRTSPDWAGTFPDTRVIDLAYNVFKASLVGSIVSISFDILFFSLLFTKVLKSFGLYSRFILSSSVSTITIMGIYVYITDFLFTKNLYAAHWLEITTYNFISNSVLVILYSVVASHVYKIVNNYLLDKKQ
ncbi:VUT family protein [Rickettsiales bacterium LUAb2]